MIKYYYIFIVSILCINLATALREYSKHDIHRLREEVREMFQHAYDGYLKYASNYDELRPLSCDGVDTWGSYSLTLIDALDTLAVMGNYTEFQRVVKLLTEKINFDSDINVSVFETNIRIVGGLISAHLMSYTAGADLEPGWPCNGPLLRLAEDVAKRLLPAFDSRTGMPYGTVNLKNGVPAGETSVTCTAGVGTFIVEFGALSRLTGDPIYEEVALNALHTLYKFKSPIGLYGNHIDVQTGRWTAQDSGIGAGVDSYYEYLVKGSVMLNRPELMEMFLEGKQAIDKYLKRDDWHVWVGMNKGQVTLPVFQSLEAYWPGVLSIFGDTVAAMKTLHNYHTVWKQYGFLPEFYNIPNAEAGANRENYPLRPELIESVMYLYRSTRDPYLLEVGEDMLRSIQHSAKTSCGYATIKNVRDHRTEDRMESFFLAETTKYLYLLFDPDNILNNDGGRGTIIDTPNGECIIEAGGYIFNTEAHPIDMGALHCCYDMRKQNLLSDYDPAKYIGDIFEFADISKAYDQRKEDVNGTTPNATTMPLSPINIQAKVDPEETRKKIVAEIMSVLKENKFNRENGFVDSNLTATRSSTITTTTTSSSSSSTTTATSIDDSIILPVEKIINPGESTSDDDDAIVTIEDPVEIVKLPPSRDPDDNKSSIQTVESTDFVTYEEENTSTGSPTSDIISTPLPTTSEEPANKPPTNQHNLSNNQLKSFFNQEKYPDHDTTPSSIANATIGGIVTNNSLLTEFVHSILKSALPSKPKFNPQDLLEKIRANGLNRNLTKNYQLLTCKAQPYLQRITVLGEFF